MTEDVKFTVVCASRKRAERVLTKELFPNLILVVRHDEVEEYEKHNPDVEVIGTPPDIDSLVKTRQWMLEQWSNLFMVDDDITYFRRNYVERGEEINIIDPDHVMEVVQTHANMAKAIGSKMWGYQSIRNPTEYVSQVPFKYSGYMNNSYMGFLEGHGLSYLTSMEEAEDHYISCLNMYKNRYTFIDRRFTFITKDNFLAEGGCNNVRNTQVMKKNTLLLRRMFGEVVNIKKPSNNKKHVHEGERSISFKW